MSIHVFEACARYRQPVASAMSSHWHAMDDLACVSKHHESGGSAFFAPELSPAPDSRLGSCTSRKSSRSVACPYRAPSNDQDQLKLTSANGNVRIRLPVAAKMALHTAGAAAGSPGSPNPVGGAVDLTKWTSISRGESFIRNIG